MLKNIGLFCKRALQKRPIFCKETYIFKHPTNRSHPIWDIIIPRITTSTMNEQSQTLCSRHPTAARSCHPATARIWWFTNSTFSHEPYEVPLRKDTWPHKKKPSSQHHAFYECHELHTELQTLHMNEVHPSTQSYSTPQNKVVIPAARLYESRTLLCDTNPSYEWGAPLYAKLLDPAKQSRQPSGALLWVTNSTLSHEP